MYRVEVVGGLAAGTEKPPLFIRSAKESAESLWEKLGSEMKYD